MRHLKLISFAVLVASCVFQVRGFPAQTEEAQPSGYFNYAKSFASRGAGLIGSGLYNGAGMVGSGLYTGAGMVGSGLYNGAGMVKNVYGEQFTMERLTRALSSVNTQSLSASIGLPDNISKAIADKIPSLDLYSVLQKLLIGQVGLQGGSMNYETAIIFLEKLAIMVPSLRKTVEGFKTVMYVTNKIKKLQAEGKPIEPMALMKETVDIYFMDVDPAFKAKLIDLSPLIYDAALGDKDAAWKVASALADRNTILQALNGMGYKNTINIIQTVIGQVSDYASTLKGADATQQKTNAKL